MYALWGAGYDDRMDCHVLGLLGDAVPRFDMSLSAIKAMDRAIAANADLNESGDEGKVDGGNRDGGQQEGNVVGDHDGVVASNEEDDGDVEMRNLDGHHSGSERSLAETEKADDNELENVD